MRIDKDKKGKLEHPTLSQTCPSQKLLEMFPSEPNLAQARSLQRRWACFRPTRPSEKSLSPSPTRLNVKREAQP